MRLTRIPLAAAWALAFSSAAALAQPSPRYTPLETIPGTPADAAPSSPGKSPGEVLAAKQFGWLDTNRDGTLSRDEVALFPRLRDAFDEADRNRDNRVSLEEMRALALQRRAEKAASSDPAPAAAPAARPVPPRDW